jgi:8-oxo-dGTP diphosphatase
METKDKAKFHIVQVQGWVRKDGKFLMAQRSFKELQAPGAWSIPGGKVETEAEIEEWPLQKTLKKEIKEEVGVVVSDTMELVYNDAFTRVDGAHVVAITFLCDYVSGEAQPLEDTEKVKWFTLDELENYEEAKGFLKRQIQALVKHFLK